jgi:TonB family protein
MNEQLDPKEAKILSDILALTLDDQVGASMTALQKIQQRAKQDGITGGALKNVFSRIVADLQRSGDRGRTDAQGGAFSATNLRSTISAQGASISLLEQRVALLQARLSQNEAARRQERQALVWSGRRLAIKTALAGVLLGGVLAGFVAFLLPSDLTSERLVTAPVARERLAGSADPPTGSPNGPPTDAGGDASADASFIPPVHDPADTAPGPEYPSDAARRGVEGAVQLLVYVEKDGHVAAIGVAHGSGYPELDVAAEQAVRLWKFRPAMRDGVPIAKSTNVTLRFVLHR